MDDPLLVRRLERIGHLSRDRQRFFDWQAGGSAPRDPPYMREPIGKRLPIYQFHDEELRAAGLLEAVDRGDMRVIQSGEKLGFTVEPRDAFGIVREALGHDLQRHLASELRIPRAIDLPHPAGAQRRKHFI